MHEVFATGLLCKQKKNYFARLVTKISEVFHIFQNMDESYHKNDVPKLVV